MRAEPNSRACILLLILMLSAGGCTFSLDSVRYYRAERAVTQQDYASAIVILQNIVLSNPDGPRALEASRLGARVAHLDAKNYSQAVEFYKNIVLHSPEAEERKSAQKFIAQIQFENLQDFNQAVVEYEKLLKLDHRPAEAFHYRLNLAKSQLRMNNVDQAVTEIDILLSQKHSAG